MSLNLKKEIWAEKINLGIINIWIIFKNKGLTEIAKRKNLAKEEIFKKIPGAIGA